MTIQKTKKQCREFYKKKYEKKIAKIISENQKLKELLKECRDEIASIDYNSPVNEREQNELLTKIDEVLK